MYNLAISLTLAENRHLQGEKLIPLIRDYDTKEVSVSPVMIIDGENMASIRTTIHDMLDTFIDQMIESGEFSEFDEEEEE